MRLCFNQLLYAFSDALDYVERDYFQTTHFHGKRVAYLCMLMGKSYHLNDQQMNDLLGCAILHDNGLTEYYKYGKGMNENEFLKIHCQKGEENLTHIHFFHDISHVILYHHEMANGEGPFHKTYKETPLYAQLIHIADYVDVNYRLTDMTIEQYQHMIDDLKELQDTYFERSILELFQKSVSFDHITQAKKDLDYILKESVHNVYQEFSTSQMLTICQLFAKIIDNKSPHTRLHSIGVATKAAQMALYYKYDEDLMMQLFFAGAMHDVGKLVIRRDILEKPAKLTDQEYINIQTHAYYSYQILDKMELGDIVHWASFHHEKLDGSGYPFGKKASELDFNDRLMACCDIYQALTEDRPYKEALSHEESIEMMRKMAKVNKIDGQIVEDMNLVFKDVK